MLTPLKYEDTCGNNGEQLEDERNFDKDCNTVTAK